MSSRVLRRRTTYRALNSHKKDRPRPLLRAALISLVVFAMLSSGAMATTYFFYGENLPSLKNFTSQLSFQDTIIRDKQGHVLFDMADMSKKGAGRRVVEPLQTPGHDRAWYRAQGQYWLTGYGQHGIPLVLQQATIATEDATFYDNWGFDPGSILRAGYDDITTGHIVSGASTITQQLIKRFILNDAPTMSRKVEEIVLAAELTQKYSKAQILWYYLNSIFYGNLSTGAEAASETYFGKPVWKLDLAQAAMLAGLPEAPSLYDPVTNLQAAKNRMQYVLTLMLQHGYLQSQSQIDQAMAETRSWKFSPPQTKETYPQFVSYVVDQLQQMQGIGNRIYSGLDVKTTLDPRLQTMAQKTVTSQIDSLAAPYHVTDGALVSLDLQHDCYGCLLAMVGSAHYDQPGGHYNMAVTPRQPGSSFKPFNYVLGFINGLGPGTSVLDGPIQLPDPGNPQDGGAYSPLDYDRSWHGVVSLRVALQNSLNVPAVRVEQFNAQQGDGTVKDTVGAEAVKLGVKSLFSDNPHCCGWALTLGGLEKGVRLIEETSAFGTFATLGTPVPPWSILQVRDRTTGQILFDYHQQLQNDKPWNWQAHGVLDQSYAYLMNNVLSDNDSRCTPAVCEFGTNSDLYLGVPAAAKTGTTEGFTDNWTVGYTPDMVTGVWVGNADNTPMNGTTGVTGAAPIWNQYMLGAIKTLNLPPDTFPQPGGVYSGSSCRTGYGGFSGSNYDVYAGLVPLCEVGTNAGYVPPQTTTYQPQATTAPVVVQPTVAATTAPVAPAPTAVPPPPTLAPAPPTSQIVPQPTQGGSTQGGSGIQPAPTSPP